MPCQCHVQHDLCGRVGVRSFDCSTVEIASVMTGLLYCYGQLSGTSVTSDLLMDLTSVPHKQEMFSF